MPEPSSVGDPFEQAKALFLDGLAALEAGRHADAEQRFVASLAMLPGRISTLVNLAATRLKLARPQEALAVADQVLAIEPDNLEAKFHRATALAQLNRPDEALAGYRALLALAPNLAEAWSHCGTLLREMGRADEAAEAFRSAIAHGADPALQSYYLAAVSRQPAPATAPPAYVESLFDDYAQGFDAHLLHALHYRAPTVLAQRLHAQGRGRFALALDLGCGTGLCGPLVEPMAERLVGVDLSSAMLAKARALGVYDELVHADIVDHLSRSDETHDLMLAADVFIYIGDLAPLFAAAHRRMRPGGLLCFTAELTEREESDFELLPSLRYAHSERYLRALAAIHNFAVVEALHQPLREDQGRPTAGLYMILARPHG